MYSVREVATVLGLTPGRLRAYLKSGFVVPQRGDKGELRFSFQDLALLRKAEGLVMQRIPPRHVHAALRGLRARLGEEAPLSRVQLEAEGQSVVVSDGGTRWEPASGQVLLDFERDGGAPAPLSELRPPPRRPEPVEEEEKEPRTAQQHHEAACALEESKPLEAVEAYRKALDVDPTFIEAHINLGRLLHERGEPFTALGHYRAALTARPDDATATFNLGVAFEDLGRLGEAMEMYERAIHLDPDNADAHYNLARLYEQTGRSDAAIRHLLLYRKLTKRK